MSDITTLLLGEEIERVLEAAMKSARTAFESATSIPVLAGTIA